MFQIQFRVNGNDQWIASPWTMRQRPTRQQMSRYRKNIASNWPAPVRQIKTRCASI